MGLNHNRFKTHSDSGILLTMDNDNKFRSPMASAWAFQIAVARGESPSTPMERAKRAVDLVVDSIRKGQQTFAVFA